ncbi:metalloregulator ArsR/SmtB family transcription factor [Micromonospora aurantiaca]|jgi:ArsR family transcriptional regulator|uniref:Helix-turn-helix transcriptional regulator n=1 Tax=Micromonospora aurantiaca (nom. illeg.) TaxID=47850 RepID=A0ABQ6UBB6_9ACTN|nr:MULTISPECIES: metalloregulator ArsR/SmtB family transcription factor [Micromonospora]KAB1107696.1 helix-turn-helix transcriptional regulator [Micromonospora aurantiaca]MBC8989950.1 helix-turn-helix transcriptional regulator [Micromonospora chalcea]MCT2280717.1 metalloregulator ArsR/SmtB family transcription factor [Micromonospora chalcea]MDG4752700.1 metalloregulator ArsR/SmtB family transcription factor [Micromonospora sp. WMMD718]OHX07005.1 transcriptional regulator [Micromonospora sp. WM
MSKQQAPLAVIDLNADTPCCPPLAQRRIPAETAAVLAPAFKALGDPVRLQLMSMIASAEGGEACVCDLTPAFDLTGPTISHHLKTLREAGLVDAERRGTWVYYRARPGILRQLAALLSVEPAPSSQA